MNLNQARANLNKILLIAGALITGPALAEQANNHSTETLYLQQCAACHGPDRLGGMGPALLPENLGRLKKKPRPSRSSGRDDRPLRWLAIKPSSTTSRSRR